MAQNPNMLCKTNIINGVVATIGQQCKGVELGYHNKHQSLIYLLCPKCSKPRWTHLEKQGNLMYSTSLCQSCSTITRNIAKGKLHNWYKQGYVIDRDGYIGVRMDKNHPFASVMQKTHGYVLQHRLVMAEYSGRPLLPNEIVHHKNGDKRDNRIENLELTHKGQHSREHGKGYQAGFDVGYKEGLTKGFAESTNKLIEELKKEVHFLRWQFKLFNDNTLLKEKYGN